MKKILNVILGLSIVMASCTDGREYVNALPKNVAAVASADLGAMVRKSGLNAEKNEARKEGLKQLVKGAMNGAGELVDALFEDAGESGIDFGKDVYAFASSGMTTYGLVAKTGDSGKLEKLLEALKDQGVCSAVEDTDGGKYAVVANWLIAYSDQAVVAMSDAKDPDARKLVRRASMMLRQEEGEGFASTADYRELKNEKADLGIWLSMDVLPRGLVNPMTMGASGDMDLKDVKGIAQVNFEKGKTVIGLRSMVDDRYFDQKLGELLTATNPVEGKLAVDFPANTPVWVTANCNGKELYDLIQSIPMGRRYFEKSMLPLDFEQIFSAMKGDCALAVTQLQRKQFILVSEVKDKQFMKAFESLKPLMKLTNGQAVLNTVGEDEYEFITVNAALVGLGSGPAAYWFGVRGNRFYLTNSRELVHRRVLGLSMEDRPFGKEIAGTRGYMSINMDAMRTERMDNAFMELLDARMRPMFGGLDYMTLKAGGKDVCSMEFVMKDKGRNLLEELLNAW